MDRVLHSKNLDARDINSVLFDKNSCMKYNAVFFVYIVIVPMYRSEYARVFGIAKERIAYSFHVSELL